MQFRALAHFGTERRVHAQALSQSFESMPTCPCGWRGPYLKQHKAQDKSCPYQLPAPPVPQLLPPSPPVPPALPSSATPQARSRRSSFEFAIVARAKMMQRLLENRLNKYHSIPTLEASAAFGAHAAELLGDFFLAQLAILAPEAVAAMQSVVAKAREVFEDMQRVQCALDQAMAALDYRKAIERPLLASRAESGAKYACMSLVQLVVELLQKDASACKYSRINGTCTRQCFVADRMARRTHAISLQEEG